MIKLKDYIVALQKLEKQGMGELPLIYASDDEGNSYQKIHNMPDVFIVEDINEYQLESGFEYDDDNKPLSFTPNCIIIN